MRKILFGSVLACFVSTAAFAQTQCDATTALTFEGVATAAQTECAASGKLKKAEKFISAARLLKTVLGNDNSATLRNIFKTLKNKNNNCNAGAAACTDDTAFTVDEVRASLETGACQAAQQQKRKSSVKKVTRAFNRMESVLDATYYASIVALLNELKNSEECAQGGTKQNFPASCDRVVSYESGDLWKPESDNTGTPVFLIGRFNSVPQTCTYIRNNNKAYAVLDNKGDSNGRAGTYRSVGPDPFCSGWPKGYVRCNISGSQTCWKVGNPCDRIE